jgi:hypothetical protein
LAIRPAPLRTAAKSAGTKLAILGSKGIAVYGMLADVKMLDFEETQ